ncbi:MAG: N-acetylmuramoyl-L-alanine amidase [Spirochaetes bacterium]|nr:N-acetylmuramoyl-L-alanine amidase [Spirochaetota bacterium]
MASFFRIISCVTILIITGASASYSAPDNQFKNPQPQSIERIFNYEKNMASREKITDIVNRIDQTYGNLLENLQKGNRLVIFFDPAHGKLPDGRWQGGDATRRSSCTGLPEEYYSILISRKMYKLLNKNKFIEVRSTDDYMAVLRGMSDSYRDIPFSTTVELADKAGAFLIISEHLNNISVLYKADGRVNLPGIHVTRNGKGRKVLQFIRDTYDGFLTLYNKVDASGFSRSYALRLNKMLVAKGLKPNSWQFGAVGDTRFSYFIDFPMSVIYESGFISNPEEEKNLKDPEYINKIVESQYTALIETVKEVFAIDISGMYVQKAGAPSPDRIELLKLARLAIYYIQAVDSNKAVRVIREMERKYSGSRFGEYTYFFSKMKKNLVNSSRHFNLAAKYKRQKKNRLARKHYSLARKYLLRAPIFAKMHERYRNELNMTAVENKAGKSKPMKIKPAKTAAAAGVVKRAPLSRSIIFPVEQNQSLEKAIETALAPDAETLKKLVRSFKNAKNTYWKKTRVYSKKKKRKVVRWKQKSRKVRFVPGIYIVKLGKNLNVISARYKNSVTLNPNRYQNQQYLKNSCFAHDKKERTL